MTSNLAAKPVAFKTWLSLLPVIENSIPRTLTVTKADLRRPETVANAIQIAHSSGW
jgi:hypothetical protein